MKSKRKKDYETKLKIVKKKTIEFKEMENCCIDDK